MDLRWMMSPSCKSTRAKSLVNYSHGPLSCQMRGAGSVELDILPLMNSAINSVKPKSGDQGRSDFKSRDSEDPADNGRVNLAAEKVLRSFQVRQFHALPFMRHVLTPDPSYP
ncbi:unnamed protein product [Mesocestoides corti]|uniref:Uncharacterized protein n=1 Tax=Mesocestoides corti TaxID=53468 RepID=A0A0R3UQW4_MESCO|nr:unnamed protein product [Mesocestoides corti]